MKGQQIWFWVTITTCIFIISIVLYAKTDFFKNIWDGIVWFYNWLKSWGK